MTLSSPTRLRTTFSIGTKSATELWDDGLYRSAKGGAIERQANNYAASILMPAPLVGEKWRAGNDNCCASRRGIQSVSGSR